MTYFPPFRKELVLLGISLTVSYSLRPSVKEVKTPQTCQPIKTLHLTRESFQNKNTSAQSRLGEHGPLSRDVLGGIQNNLKIFDSTCPSLPRGSLNKVQPNLF